MSVPLLDPDPPPVSSAEKDEKAATHILIVSKGTQQVPWKIFYFFVFPRAALRAYGGSQARGLMGAVDAGLHHSHSNVGSEPSL